MLLMLIPEKMFLGNFSSFFNINTPVASYKLMKLTDIEIDDIASLSLHYSYEIVINALFCCL